MKNGYGILSFSDGNEYKGEWKNDQKNGFRIVTYFDGNKYVGEWLND